ncbi:MAG: enoyl-CoA hydratase/isomerase family protein [Alphaproteobacteria bacterium]|nr:enoyl-CoA hydratase/isomerase family protein [Alphaproteobacteria bacterium]
MPAFGSFKDVTIDIEDHVAVVEFSKPSQNFFDVELISEIADAFEGLDETSDCRAIVLASPGRIFCAGANLNDGRDLGEKSPGHYPLYEQGVRLFRTTKPIVGAIQGAAIGGGFGLAMTPDFRVACPESRFSANFTRMGYHPGFGLTVTLPETIGRKHAERMLYNGCRVKGEEAFAMGLADVLVDGPKNVRPAAIELAREIAQCSPLGVVACRTIMRDGYADRIAAATDKELANQNSLRGTADFTEGVEAMTDRRLPHFIGA